MKSLSWNIMRFEMRDMVKEVPFLWASYIKYYTDTVTYDRYIMLHIWNMLLAYVMQFVSSPFVSTYTLYSYSYTCCSLLFHGLSVSWLRNDSDTFTGTRGSFRGGKDDFVSPNSSCVYVLNRL